MKADGDSLKANDVDNEKQISDEEKKADQHKTAKETMLAHKEERSEEEAAIKFNIGEHELTLKQDQNKWVADLMAVIYHSGKQGSELHHADATSTIREHSNDLLSQFRQGSEARESDDHREHAEQPRLPGE